MEKEGDFCFDAEHEHIYLWLPGRLSPSCLQISRVPSSSNRVWRWDGDKECPTVTPSIHDVGMWHGYLTKGKLVSC